MMARAKIKLPGRLPPKRTITKQQAVRHLIHSAARMIAAGEDPFAIHLLIQSADKLLIDLARRTGRTLAFNWGEFVKPEYKDAVLNVIRETSNFFKHADRDHDATLHVGDIAKLNILQLGICIVNYHGLFGEWTDHMKLLFSVAKFISPDGFVLPDQREQFDAALPKLQEMTLNEYLDPDVWDDPLIKTVLPNLASERDEDLQDTRFLYSARISDMQKE
jgi:hypothetical protein